MIVEDLHVAENTNGHYTVFQKAHDGQYIDGSGARFSLQTGTVIFKAFVPVRLEDARHSMSLNGYFSDSRHETQTKKLYNSLDLV